MLFNALLAAAAAQPTTPLPPNGNWTVAYEDNMCLASRKFGADGEVTLVLRPSPLNEVLELTVLDSRDPTRSVALGQKATVTPSSGQPDLEATYIGFHRPSGERALIVQTKKSMLDGIGDDGVITVSPARDRAYSFSMKHASKLKPVIEDCRKTLLRHWGIDPAESENIAAPAEPVGDRAAFINTDDYPADALRKGQSGTVAILWAIGLDGRASACRVVLSSGVSSLDQAACAAIMKKARYRPAVDKAGRPMISHDSRRVNWIVPR